MPTIKQMVLEKMAKEWLPLDQVKNVGNPYLWAAKMVSERPRRREVREMRTTWYNKTGNPMANWKMPEKWDVAVSDRSIPLGSTIVVDWKKYRVSDRTAKWVHEKKWDTVDIFYDEPKEETIKRGAPKKKVEIIYND